MKQANHVSSPIKILVTAVGGGAVGRQVVKALHHSDLQTYIVGTDVSEYATGFSAVDKTYLVPRADADDYIETVLEICKKEGIQFLVPGFEKELEVIAQHRSVFEDKGIKILINDLDVISVCFNKSSTFKVLEEHGFLIPKTWDITTEEDIAKVSIYPVVIKPTTQSGGSRNVFIARDVDELEYYVVPLLRQDIAVIVQEYVGTSEEEYTVGVLTTPDTGALVGSIALKRILKSSMSIRLSAKAKDGGPPLVISSGFSQGLFEQFPDVREACEKIAVAMGSRGPLNIQCRKTEKGIYPFEINPRLSGTTYLRSLVGYNEPEVLINYYLSGKLPETMAYHDGYVLRELKEKYVSIEEVESRRKSVI